MLDSDYEKERIFFTVIIFITGIVLLVNIPYLPVPLIIINLGLGMFYIFCAFLEAGS